MKRSQPGKKRVDPKRMIQTISQIFKASMSKPALKNTMLVAIAIGLSKTLRVNQISSHLPIGVKSRKTKQKRLLRFAKSNYPVESVMEKWAIFVLSQVTKASRGVVLILVDETTLLGPYKACVAAVPFRKRAIPIYWRIYTDADIQSMKIVSHNVLVQQFCDKLTKLVNPVVPVNRQLLVFDRGFARARLMKWFNKRKIPFLIRVPKNVGIEIYGRPTKLSDMTTTQYHTSVVYHKTERIVLNLYCLIDANEDDPMFIVSNLVRGVRLYHCYRRRMQIEQAFRDIKSLMGFGQLRLKQLTHQRIGIFWLWVVISHGLLFLLYEKSGYRWSKEFNDTKKQFSLIAVIKSVISECWKSFRLHPHFEWPLPLAHILSN